MVRSSRNLRLVLVILAVLPAALVAPACGSGNGSRVVGKWVTDVDATTAKVFSMIQATAPPELRSHPGDASYPVVLAETRAHVVQDSSWAFSIRADGGLHVRRLFSALEAKGAWQLQGTSFTTSFPGGGGGRWILRDGRLWATFGGSWLVMRKKGT